MNQRSEIMTEFLVLKNDSKYEKLSEFCLDLILFYAENKLEIKLSFNDYFYIEFNKLLGFK
jgi:hypothetical protein